MKIAVCPGSFDPITKGHVDIIERAGKIFDRVIILVSKNPVKDYSFTAEEKIVLINSIFGDAENIMVDVLTGLLVDYMKRVRADVIVKGLRAVSDFEYEFQMALANKKLYPEIETVFLTAKSEYMYLSSSLVRQIAGFGGDVSDFVPLCILDKIVDKLNNNYI